MGISHVQVKHKHPKRQPQPAELQERDSGCPNNFYTSPSMSSTVDALQPLPITWNTACLASNTTELIIYLYTANGDLASTSNSSRLHVWTGVNAKSGSYSAELMPRWWGSTASQLLQVSIVPSEVPIFMNTLPGGPIFTATYAAPTASGSSVPAAANTNIVDASVTQVGGIAVHTTTMTAGKKAAAVIMPLLFLALCVGAYLKLKRTRNIDKRKKWTEAVDKRMSTISTDWKSVSGAGANAAIRNSIAVAAAGNRNSSFSFGALRPSSTFAVEGDDNLSEKRPAGVRTGTGVGLRNPAGLSSTTSVDRVSRVSFAPDTRVSRVSFAESAMTGRPSGESSRRTRAFHSAYIPPVPALPAALERDIVDEREEELEGERRRGSEEEANSAASFSPRQAQGALTLTPEDIRSRIVAGRARAASNAQKHHPQADEKNNNFEELMPALAMMRTGSSDPSRPDEKSDELLFNSAAVQVPVSPPPAYPKAVGSTPAQVPYYSTHNNSGVEYPQLQAQAQSPVMASMPMQPMPASVMSPDEMLRAYAERKKALAASASSGSLKSSSGSATSNSGGGGNKPVISYPVPVANVSEGNGSGMRVLFNATSPTTPTPTPTANYYNTESQYSIGTAGTDSSSFVYNPQGQGPYQYQQNSQFEYNFSSTSDGQDASYPDQYNHNLGMTGHQQQGQEEHPFGRHHQTTGSVGVGRYGGAQYAIGGDDHDHEEGEGAYENYEAYYAGHGHGHEGGARAT